MDSRIDSVRRFIYDHVHGNSPKHVRDGYELTKVAALIVESLERGSSIWRKWTSPREDLVRTAAACWVPVEALVDHLNGTLGPRLTSTDVLQRMRSFQESGSADYPNEQLRDACLSLFEREQALGTELPAIVGALHEFVEHEEQRLREESEAKYKMLRRAKREALEQRFRAGADCKWTAIQGAKAMFCRVNGRAYRITQDSDKVFELYRVEAIDDPGVYVGRYRLRGDATKAVERVAYAPDLVGVR